jgi:hypothetical protein
VTQTEQEIQMNQANQTAAATEYKFTPWDELSRRDQLACIYSDAYKDAYNFRPRGVDTSDWTEAMFESELAYLQTVIERNENARLEDEAFAAIRLEETIDKMMECGCRNREMAIRWLHDIYETNGDTEYLEYNLGVNYGYFSSKNNG